MAPDPGLVPKPAGMVRGAMSWGVPLAAGFGGFLVGDVFDARGLVASFTGDLEAQLPFSSRIDYNALIAIIPYGVGVAIVGLVAAKIGTGEWTTLIFRSAKWFLFGVMARLVLAGFIPGRVPATGMLAMPQATR